VGYNGTILHTTNGGTIWLNQSTTPYLLLGVSFSDANNGMIVGNGIITQTTNGGITFIGNEKTTNNPEGFVLFQNYPNPFNPNTTINFSVLKQNNVKIKVYDVLGNEILTLINEDKPKGYYKIEFNASNLSSGIYYYQMQTDGFIQTKKMILLK
jgi:hypothetical protein